MADVELLVSEPIRVEIEGGTAHIFLRSGGEDLRFAMSLLDFRGSVAKGQVEIWRYDEIQQNVVPIARKKR